MTTFGIILTALGIGGFWFVVLATVLDDRSIADDECHCDYSGGECDRCYAERRASWDDEDAQD